MIVSSVAVLISLFNMVMCAQNEFDPIVLEEELHKRRNKQKERDELEAEDREIER